MSDLCQTKQLKVIEGDELVNDDCPANGVGVFADRSNDGTFKIPDDRGASKPEEH